MTIFIIFLIFIGIQIYYYMKVYTKNINKINKIESFQNTLKNINDLSTKKEYFLDDTSLNNLLEDYNKLNNND
jgi:hypothetical protein